MRDLADAQFRQSWKCGQLALHGHSGKSTFKMFQETELILIYCEFDGAIESSREQNVGVNHHAVYGVVMDLHLSIRLIRKHPREVDLTLGPRREYVDFWFRVGR